VQAQEDNSTQVRLSRQDPARCLMVNCTMRCYCPVEPSKLVQDSSSTNSSICLLHVWTCSTPGSLAVAVQPIQLRHGMQRPTH
jgi:hypothetical protein